MGQTEIVVAVEHGQLVMCSDDGHEETVTDIVTLKKDCQRIEHLGLTLKEAKQLLKTTQQRRLPGDLWGHEEAS